MTLPLIGAICGFGFIAERGHLPAYLARPDCFSIAAVADVSFARRALATQLIPGVRVYKSAHAMLAAESARLDFVDIATPPSEHAILSHAALDRGLHVFCEKPIATTASDARAVITHAATARRVFFPSHNYLHAPVIRAMRAKLDAGEIGKIHLVTLQTFRPTHAKGVADWKVDWRRSRRYAGGGIAMDHASHSFYLAFDWLASYPTSVTAHVEYRAGLDTEDGFTCTVTFPTGTANIHLTWNGGLRSVMYSLHGEHGALLVDDDELHLSRTGQPTEHSSVASHWIDASHATWFETLQLEFVEAIRTEQHVGKYATDSLYAIELIEAAYASARDGSAAVALPQPPMPWLRSIAR